MSLWSFLKILTTDHFNNLVLLILISEVKFFWSSMSMCRIENNGWHGIGIHIISVHKINVNTRSKYSSHLEGKGCHSLSPGPIHIGLPLLLCFFSVFLITFINITDCGRSHLIRILNYLSQLFFLILIVDLGYNF